MTVPTILIITAIVVLFAMVVSVMYMIADIMKFQEKLHNEYQKVTRILGVDDIRTKPTKYEAGDIVIVRNTRTNENHLVHLRNVYCRNKTWLYSGIQIEFVKAPLKYGVRKIPTYVTTISGIREEDIQGLDNVSMKVFKWAKEDL